MATNYYLGTGDWDETTSWSLGSVPVNAEDVLVDAGSYAIPGFDASAVDLTSLRIGAGFTGTLGSAASPMQINAVTTYIVGSQGCYLRGATGKLLQNVFIDKRYAVDTPVQIGGYISKVYALRGNVTMAGDTALDGLTYVHVMHHGNPVNDVRMKVEDGAVISQLWIHGGMTTCSCALVGLYLIAGEVEHTKGTITLVEQHGGLIRWNANETITGATLYAGKFDATDNKGGSTAPTITNLTMYVNSLCDLRNGLNNIVIGGPTLYGSTGPLEDS